MEDLDLILQQYVATANNPEYNLDWDVINSKFPELAEYDPIALQEYVATANNPKYGKDWGVINDKFPEFKTKSLPFEYAPEAREQVLLQTEKIVGIDSKGKPKKELFINKDFFNQEDEDVAAQLTAQFGDAYNFKEVIFHPEYGFSGVEISTKDGKHSEVIETNIWDRFESVPKQTLKAVEKWKAHGEKDLDDEIWDKPSLNSQGKTVPLLTSREKNLIRTYQEREKAYETAFNKITSFMDTHATDETNIAIGKKEQQIRKDVQAFHEYTKQDIKAIENEYSKENQPDLFKPTTKVTYTPTTKSTIPGGLGGGHYKETTTIQPYEDELKLAQQILGIEPKDVNANIEIIQDKAREIIIENERKRLRELKTTEMLEELEDGEILPVSLQHYADDTDALKNVLTIGEKMFNKEYAVKAEEYTRVFHELENDKSIENFTILADKLRNPEYKFNIKEGEETVFLEDGREIPTTIIEQYEEERIRLKPLYEKFFRLQNDLIDNQYNITDSKTQLDLVRRNYNDWEKFWAKTGLGFRELGANIMASTDDPIAHKRWMDVKREIQTRRDKYAKPIDFDNAFSSWENFGHFVGDEFANQISIFTSLAVPYVGWGTLLASTYGEQWGTMTAEEIKMKAGAKFFNPEITYDELEDVGYSTFRKVATSTGYAVPEFVFEYLTTIPLLRSAGLALKGAFGVGVRDQVKKGVYTVFKENAPTWATLSIAQSLGEGATTVTQNVVTGKPWHLNVDHSMFSGLMFGTTLGSIPTVTGAVTSVLSDYNQNEEYRNNLKKQNKFVQDNKNLDTKIRILKKRGKDGRNKEIRQAEADKKSNQQKIDELNNTNDNILKNQKEGIFGRWLGWGDNNQNGMGEGALKAYLDVTKEQEQIRLEAERIENSDGYSRNEKNRRLEDLRKKGFTDASGKYHSPFAILQGARDSFRSEKNSEFNQWKALGKNKVELDTLLEEAQDYIDNPDSDRANKLFNFKGLKDKSPDNIARILWNIKEINRRLITPGRNTNLDNDLVVYQTVEEAIAKLKELDVDVGDIQKIKDGSHGFDGPNNKSYIVVENMAKDDRLQIKTHELSHRLLRNAISSDPRAFQEIADTVLEWAKENDSALHTRLLRSVTRDDSGTMVADEVIAVFLEEAGANRVNLKMDGIAGVFGFMASKVMKDKHGIDMDLAGESDAIKLLIGLGKKLAAGKMTLKDVKALMKSEIIRKARLQGKMLDVFAPENISKTKFSESPDIQPTTKEDLFAATNRALIEALDMYGVDNPERLLSDDIEVRKELAKEWEALGDSRFWIGSMIGEHWRRFIEINYLSKRDKAANYNLYKDQILDVVTTGIESGDNGIPFLVRSWKPAEKGGRTLTSHIFGEIETRLMKANGIIDRKFPQFDKFTSVIDVTTKGGMDIKGDLGVDEVLKTEKRKKERKKTLEEDRYRKQIGIDDKFANEIKLVIKEILLSGDLGLINNFEWTQRFSKAAQKKLFTIIKKEMKDYEAFLKKTRKPFMKHAHTSDLVQMEKNEKIKILAKLIAVDASPAKIKKALTEELIQPFEVKSMTQGPNIYKKMDPSLQEFTDFMKVRGRKDAFVKNNINIIAMDAVFDVLLNETVEVVDDITGKKKTVPVLDEFIKQQKEKGLPHVSNVLAIVKERINRDQDVKFSNTVRNFGDLDLRIFYGKLDAFGEILNIINVGDEAAVYQTVYTVWGEDYNNTTLTALSKDLFKLVKRYATINKNHTNLKTKPEKTLNDYLYDNLKAAELEITLAEFLELKDDKGKFIKLSTQFDNIGRINNQRAEIVTFGNKLVKKYGEEKALMMLVHASGMYGTSTKISRGNFLVNDEGKVYRIKPEDVGKEQFTEQRYQVFTGKKDFNKNVLQKIFPNIKLTDIGNLRKFQEVTVKGKKVEVDISLLAEKSKEAMEDRDFEAREAQAKLSEEFVLEIAQHFKDQVQKEALDKTDFGMLMMSMASNMHSPLKRAANLKYIYKDKRGKKYKGELRYEHMIPTNFMVLKITDAFMSDKSNVNLDALFKEYTVAVIPVTMDNMLEEMGFQYVMPIGYEAGQSSRVRYYNMSTYGHPDLYAIESIDPKDKGKIYSAAAANIKYGKNVKSTKVLTNAVVKARMSKFSEISKGITVLDFDDTLAITKSNVRYRLPNPTHYPGSTFVSEENARLKVVFMAGPPGSGKSNVIKQLGLGNRFKIVDADAILQRLIKKAGLPANMKNLTLKQKNKLQELMSEANVKAAEQERAYQRKGDGVIVDTTGATRKGLEMQVKAYQRMGYDVGMVFVEASGDVALARNEARKERSLPKSTVENTRKRVMENKESYRKLFGKNFTEVNTDNLKQGDPMPKTLTDPLFKYLAGYYKGRLNASEYADQYQDLLEQGAEFDFTEFDKVINPTLAPLFNKALKLQEKFGPENMFILTARPEAAQQAIYDFLKASGLNIPLKNISALGNSTAEAKALWIAEKVGEGYNDFYFADDALKNVQAVKNMLDQFDVKSKVQQAKTKFSETMNDDFNTILEDVTGIDAKKRFSTVKARKRGDKKGGWRLFIPPSHEDFAGLLYNFMGKGKKGDAHRKFFEKALIRPLNRAFRELDTARQSVANDYKSLNKEFSNVKDKLTKKTPDGDFTYSDAIRVYLWNKHGYKIPGLSETDQQKLVDLVTADQELQVYAETLNVISKREDYVKPTDGWESGDIRMDLDDATGRVGRSDYFTEFNENADIIFSEENLNKIEATFGKDFREALEDMLYRIQTGKNRPKGNNSAVNIFVNYLNGSVGVVMFLNMRSAVLQQLSIANYVNFADNNIFAAAKAFANQKQYWTDFVTIFNSDMLKQRRGGIRTDVNAADLVDTLRGSRFVGRVLVAKLLQLGFTPTQIGDSFAIAAGGATFYRNRIKTYLKDGLSQKEAEAKAWTDFQDITQSTQQSARPDMVSQQQASPIGKFILNFQNITSQYNRFGKKAFLDIKNRRITPPNKTLLQSDISNASRILYYFAIQNLIFYSLQTALFAAMFDDDEEDKKFFTKKRERLINGSIDSVLRGTGWQGAVVATLKNMAIKFAEQRKVGYNPDESSVLMEMLNVSPVIGIKGREISNAEKTLNYNKKVIKEMETFDIDNPMWSAVTNYIEGTTNIPVNRLYKKTQNVRQSLSSEHEAWQRILMFLGWSQYNLGIKNPEVEKVKEKLKKKSSKKKSSNTTGRKTVKRKTIKRKTVLQ